MIEHHTRTLEAALIELQGNLAVMYRKIAMYADIEANLQTRAADQPTDKEPSYEQASKLSRKNTPARR